MLARLNGYRHRFRSWRRGRPFWGGLIGLLAAVVIAIPVATLKLGDLTLTLQSLGGMSAALISAVLVCCGIGVWVRPEFRVPCGIVTMIAALISLPNINLGGFFIGLLLGLTAGSLMIAWAPPIPTAEGEEVTDTETTAQLPAVDPVAVEPTPAAVDPEPVPELEPVPEPQLEPQFGLVPQFDTEPVVDVVPAERDDRHAVEPALRPAVAEPSAPARPRQETPLGMPPSLVPPPTFTEDAGDPVGPHVPSGWIR